MYDGQNKAQAYFYDCIEIHLAGDYYHRRMKALLDYSPGGTGWD